MNKQVKTKIDPESGQVVIVGRGIEWTDYTWNPVGGCQHGCRWRMPDGTIAICYADSTVQVMKSGYPQGFEHHYWRPHMLKYPLSQKKPAKIFMDSMSDLMGRWVPREQVEEVFSVCRQAHWHTFQLLTKNAPHLLSFDLPKNVWAGVSAPPTFMFGKELTSAQQRSFVFKQLDTLAKLKQRGHAVCWMSIEPLSFNIAEVFMQWLFEHHGEPLPLDWAVIGAASDGQKHFQPTAHDVEECHRVLRAQGCRIFHKGNLEWQPHLEEWPEASRELKQEALI